MNDRVLHVITGLGRAGAEGALIRLLSGLAPQRRARHAVICLGRQADRAPELRALGVECWLLGGHGRQSAPWLLPRLVLKTRAWAPDCVVGWMYDGNLAAWLAARSCGARVVWNIRHSLSDLALESRSLRVAIALNRRLAGGCAAIVYNSQVARGQHEQLGFPAATGHVIANGIPLPPLVTTERRRAARAALGLPDDAYVIGQVARFHPMKGHRDALEAFARLWRIEPRARLVLVGRGLDAGNARVQGWLSELGVAPVVQCLGERTDVMALLPAFDVSLSASRWGEGYSNVLAESVLSGIPAVATDVGDSRAIVGAAGAVVAAGQVDALAAALLRLWQEGAAERTARGAEGRQRLLRETDLERVLDQHGRIWSGEGVS